MPKNTSEEKRRHSSLLKPYSYYYCCIPDYFPNVPMHWHSEFELNVIRSGCGEFICGDIRFMATAGDVVIIQPNMLHAINSSNGTAMRYDTVVFSGEMLCLSSSDRASELLQKLSGGGYIMPHIAADNSHGDELSDNARRIADCAKADTALSDLQLKSELLRFFWLLLESGSAKIEEKSAAARSEILRPALVYIREHFCEELSVAELADAAHLSKSYFMALFRQTTGLGVMEYIIQLRIREACVLLSRTNKTVAEIAFQCGFRNLSNFNRQFSHTAGCTPSQYRKTSSLG